MTPRDHSSQNEIFIDANEEWNLPRFRELWLYRELLWTLTLRDIKVRYKQTAIGIAWAVLQPFVTMVVFTIIFGGLAKLPSDGVPYAVFAMTAILPWQFFSRALTQGSMSLVTMGAMLSKIYFPRLFAPLASVFAGLIDFFIAFVILIGVMVAYDVYPGPAIVVLPFFILMSILTSLAVSLWLSGINVVYRDVQHSLPFLVQIWMFLTPVVYPLTMVPESYRIWYMLNPMAGVVEGFRWAMLGHESALRPEGVLVSLGVVVVLFISGLRYFNRVEKSFVDRL